jgi:O-acetyl-ADP-ribose deacetylase (regulator of RNase III)
MVRPMKISVFAGDICDAHADALCTSTNPRLSLAMGTGGSVRGRGGYGILRQCEAIVAAESRRSGRRGLPAGSAHQTTAGELPAKLIIHCVASDDAHRTSAAIIAHCVASALALAGAAGCETIALPVFGSGHARFRFDDALRVMMETLRDCQTSVRHAIIVVFDSDRVEDVLRIIRGVMPGVAAGVQYGPASEERVSMWPAEW